ncbi:HNH endonuclease family protein [Leifsonia sp. A12D58]|uniref:HNH endonuclease family protein n=1 Tax=Leifsonia sp. A12D58 TaxID=3397674 RepID=UPI0039E028CA
MDTTRAPFAVSKILRERRLINLEPTYQREAGVWSTDKKQLFIDSVINGYDVPKIYVHKVDQDATGFAYAVVDGKQRISTILEFLDGKFEFAEDFKYLGYECDVPPKPGDTFKDLEEQTRDIFKEKSLDVVVIETDDEDDIEELFSRLNNGEKLNAAESRNAIGGTVAALVRELVTVPFFTEKIRFTNRRYSHYEVACKLLFIEHVHQKTGVPGFVDLKKKYLDGFVRDNKLMSTADAAKLRDRVTGQLNAIVPIFIPRDIELEKQSYPQLMYLFGKEMLSRYGAVNMAGRLRDFLAIFRLSRAANLKLDEEARDPELVSFGLYMQQGTNDAGSMERRVEILTRRFLLANPDVQLKDTSRTFSLEERWVLWQRAAKKCQECGVELATLEELDGDHIIWHHHGGPTSLENARALCISCNRGMVKAELVEA